MSQTNLQKSLSHKMNDHLFVYGTLRKEFQHSTFKNIEPYVQFINKGHFMGHQFEIDWYPGAINTKENAYPIIGDIYEVFDKKVWEILDEYEGCSTKDRLPHEYIKKRLDITTSSKKQLKAIVYLFALSTDGYKELTSGDFWEYKNK